MANSGRANSDFKEPTDLLQLGDRLNQPVYAPSRGSREPVLLLAAGQKIDSEPQLRRLRDAGFAVLLPSEASDAGTSFVSADQIYPPAERSFAKRAEGAQRLRHTVTEATRNLLRRVVSGDAPDVPELLAVSSELASEVMADPYALSALTHLRQCDEYTVEHCADVAILMVAIARLLGHSGENLKLLALAGLMHDVGKQRLPGEILEKPGPLTDAEFVEVRKHPEYGRDILRSCSDCPEPVLAVVMQHHERVDGSGYPLRLTGDVVHPFSLIAAVADTFDAMTADRVYRKGLPAREALVEIWSGRERLYDTRTATALVKLVGVYPVGTRVRLNTGERGVVIAPNPWDTTRPVVQVDRDRHGRPLSRAFQTNPQNTWCWIVAAERDAPATA